jgi:hypothetical protein
MLKTSITNKSRKTTHIWGGLVQSFKIDIRPG